MSDQPAATVTVWPDLVAELDRRADATGRSRSELVEAALAGYLDVQRARIEGVHAALRDLEAGRPDLSHEEVCARTEATVKERLAGAAE